MDNTESTSHPNEATATSVHSVSKALVLLSGGLDSATVLYTTIKVHGFAPEDVLALSFDYEQRHSKEVTHAMALAADAGVDHNILTSITFPKNMLTDPDTKVPDVSYDEIEGVSPMYVPFRNGTFISRAASEAQARGYGHVVLAAHAEDARAWAYPDCSPEFIGAMSAAIWIGTYGEVRLLAPFQNMTKANIVQIGADLGVPFHKTWSCYKGGTHHCGTCATCLSRKESFKRAKVEDPTIYLSD